MGEVCGPRGEGQGVRAMLPDVWRGAVVMR